MIRIINRRIISLAALLILGASAAAQEPHGRPVLKASATVAAEIVHIGDLVEHAGPLAEIAIFRAPDPGFTGSVSTSRVLDALRPYGLDGVATRGLAEVVVSRTSRALTSEEIESGIRRALAGQQGLGAPADLTLTLDQTLRTIHLEPTASGELQVVRLAYDPRRRRFDIVFDIPGSTILSQTPLHLSGVVTETAEVVTLAHAIRRGDLVKRSDLVSVRRPRREIASDAVVQPAAAIGLAARRTLSAGQALHQADLMKPELVQRNEGVTLVYAAPGITLTVRGKALESGAEGDVISVVNLQSKRTLQGSVIGPGRVSIAPIVTRVASVAPNRRQADAAKSLSPK